MLTIRGTACLPLLVLVASCASPAPASRCEGDGPAVGLTFLFTHISFGAFDRVETPGLDLDGLDSERVASPARCADRHADAISSFDGAERGVDNFLGDAARVRAAHGTIPPTPLTYRLDDLITTGDFMLVVHLPDPGVLADGPVEVLLGRARVPGCVPGGGAECTPCRDGPDLLEDQLVELGELDPASGRIEGGTLTIAASDVDLPVAALEWAGADPDVTVHLDRFELELPLGPSRALVPVGGTILVPELARVGRILDPEFAALTPDEQLATLERVADLGETPDAGPPCAAYSIGFEAELTRVRAVAP